MSNRIYSWLRAFRELETVARDSRGATQLGASTNAIPNTTCSDVISIAVVLDPYVRSLSTEYFNEALVRRWESALVDLRRDALLTPTREYVHNRSFWGTLAALCIAMEFDDSELPAEHVWDSLLALVAEEIDRRNAGPQGDGPFKRFDNVKGFDDLYIAQFNHLRQLRGSDPAAPKNGPVPLTTNDDVVQLADYWSKQLANVKVVMGHDGIVKRWKAAVADVDALARKADPYAVFAKNLSFWPALKATAIHISVAQEVPSDFDLAIESVKDNIKKLPENLKDGAAKAAEAIAGVTNDVAQGVNKIAKGAGAGLFSGFGTPLIVGAGLLGLFLVSRNRAQKTAEG